MRVHFGDRLLPSDVSVDLSGLVIGDLVNQLCTSINTNKIPAIHIAGQTLQPEPVMSHAII